MLTAEAVREVRGLAQDDDRRHVHVGVVVDRRVTAFGEAESLLPLVAALRADEPAHDPVRDPGHDPPGFVAQVGLVAADVDVLGEGVGDAHVHVLLHRHELGAGADRLLA